MATVHKFADLYNVTSYSMVYSMLPEIIDIYFPSGRNSPHVKMSEDLDFLLELEIEMKL